MSCAAPESPPYHLLSITNDRRRCCRWPAWSGNSCSVCCGRKCVNVMLFSEWKSDCLTCKKNYILSHSHSIKCNVLPCGNFSTFSSSSRRSRSFLFNPSLLTANKQNESVMTHFQVQVFRWGFQNKGQGWRWPEVPRAARVNEFRGVMYTRNVNVPPKRKIDWSRGSWYTH